MEALRNKCLIWTRVSTDEQEESLKIQEEAVTDYASYLGFRVVVSHKPVRESAKIEGKQFKAMIKKLKDPRNQFDGVVVDNLDRFSRYTPTATRLIRELREKGVYLYSRMENVSSENENDLSAMDGYFSRAEHENRLKSQRIKNHVAARIKQGYWTSKPPFGYKRDTTTKDVIPSPDAYLVTKAFHMANAGMTLKSIEEHFKKNGVDKTSKRIGEFLRNKFYCGIIVHSSLNGEEVIGRHQPIISRLEFEQVQSKLKSHKNVKMETSQTFLKGTIKCCGCNSLLTAYSKLKGGQVYYYYKCGTTGCKVNISNKKLDKVISNKLEGYSLDQEVIDEVQSSIIEVYEEFYGFSAQQNSKLREKRSKLRKRLESLEIKFLDGDISEQAKEKVYRKTTTELEQLEQELDLIDIPNIEEFMDSIFKDLNNLSSVLPQLDDPRKEHFFRLIAKDSFSYSKELNFVKGEFNNPYFKMAG